MQYLGDYAEDYADLNFKFHTHKADGTAITLGGTPAISVYKSNSTTQSTAGVTLSVDFDSVTGMHNVQVDLSADAFYAAGEDYQVVITTGTVDSISVAGTVVASFSIENRFNEVVAVTVNDKTGYELTAAYDAAKTAATQSSVDAIDNYIDTEMADILAAVDTEVAAIKAKTDNLPASPAAVGSEMALANGAITAAKFGTGAIDAAALAADAGAELAAALLDLAAGVETGLTVREALRLIVGEAACKLSGAASSTNVFRNYGDTKNRITATVDADGNRTAVTYDLT